MPDLLAQGSAWLEQQRRQYCTRPVTYRRGAAAVELAATVGATKFERHDTLGAVVESQMRDYLIDAAELVLDGQPTLPQRGDWIEETDGARTYRYEARSLGGEPCWRYSDPYRRTLRIHTQALGSEHAG